MQRIRDEIDAERHAREAERLANEPSNGARSHDGRRRIGGIRECRVPAEMKQIGGSR